MTTLRTSILCRFLALLAAGLAMGSAHYFSDGYNNAALDTGLLLLILSGVTLWLALWTGPRLFSLIDPAPVLSLAQTPLQRITILLALASLWGLAEFSGRVFGWPGIGTMSQHLQFILLIAALIGLAWGFGGLMDFNLRRLGPDTWLELGLLLAITLVALFLRTWRLGSLLEVFVDEIHFTDAVRTFWTRFDQPLLEPFSKIAAFPAVYPYMQSLGVAFFGRDLGSIRVVSALFGTLTVPALYLLARVLFDRRTALAAALLLATFPPHLQLSRVGLNNVADPLFGVLALALLARGIRYGRAGDFVLGGIALGLTQYFYEGGRLFFPALIAIWTVWMLRTRWRATSQGALLRYLLLALIVAAPIYYVLIGLDHPAAQRVSVASLPADYWTEALNAPGTFFNRYIDRLRDTSLLVMSRPEAEFYYNGHQPLVMVQVAPALILGIAAALWHWRTPGGSLLVLWFTAPLMVLALLMLNLATAARLVVMFPALALLIAYGLRVTLGLLLTRWVRPQAVVIVGIAMGLALLQTHYYFGTHIDAFVVQHYNHQPGQAAVFAARDIEPPAYVHIVMLTPFSEVDARAMLNFFDTGMMVDTYHPDEINAARLSMLPRDIDHAFYLDANAVERSLAVIASDFDLVGPFLVDPRYGVNLQMWYSVATQTAP